MTLNDGNADCSKDTEAHLAGVWIRVGDPIGNALTSEVS